MEVDATCPGVHEGHRRDDEKGVQLGACADIYVQKEKQTLGPRHGTGQ